MSDRKDQSTDLPPRIAARPDPSQWGPDDLMTLEEAAALFFPDGPIGVPGLRTAIRDGVLPVAVIARKHLVTRRAIEAMSRCAPLSPRSDADDEGESEAPAAPPAVDAPPPRPRARRRGDVLEDLFETMRTA